MPARVESLAAVLFIFCTRCQAPSPLIRTYFWAMCEATYGEVACCGNTVRVSA